MLSDTPLSAKNSQSPPTPLRSQSDALSFLSTICGSLKRIKRTGWVRCGVPLPESDSDHMHRCAMCALLYQSSEEDDYSLCPSFHPSNVNGNKLLRMAVSHDLCESLAGDITPFCDAISSKHGLEEAAMQQIKTVVGDPLGSELYNLWKEYEEQVTPEAVICKDIDKFEMVMQAFEYEEAHLRKRDDVTVSQGGVAEVNGYIPDVTSGPLRTFYVTTNNVMKTPLFRRLDRELREKREKMLIERGWTVTVDERQKYI
eukprot:CAMPEP_0113318202 /NCGR_PEP_ID=MMETSP0010_2-20120614/12848_1 /TAXON_ID=216773 ORGANISM="Corethron hystrix, Strain 308" /NCGR_SAMPLE_ID=MMETSP0010_2 /ASSEMBLY_ACC=CAM_ASM_000155 /LENGTH=256 /DNA_ID=CAMNT_0000175423 /DNA_START=21 /DNA_END=791 /DNA_ORIENTATION=- /assembly_acc=CAM_ASM_000155